jgi:sterol desaturase/sphingolipid hydroxylase (fatty acid hydroxylase superfamily)
MKIDPTVQRRMMRNAALSLFIYALPVLLMFLTLYLSGSKPWDGARSIAGSASGIHHATSSNTHGYGFMLFIVVLGVIEFSFGLYGHEWTRNEKALDLACFAIPKLLFAPFFAWFSLTVLPRLFPRQHNIFGWVSFFWGVLILCVADDLTQYWYHRVHHEIPWLWRFHRTHHSAPYMGMSMAGRQNAIYSIFFSQTYLTSILVYLGFGPAAVVVLGVKSTITTLAHSSIPWDKPLYRFPALHPIAWVVERVISTPATHHAHHASNTDDGIGFYKGNFGNMFFLWDVIFGTAHISRQYPSQYGISHYEGDPWYAQLFWPIFKSNIPGSELAADGPVVRTDVTSPEPIQEFSLGKLPLQV